MHCVVGIRDGVGGIRDGVGGIADGEAAASRAFSIVYNAKTQEAIASSIRDGVIHFVNKMDKAFSIALRFSNENLRQCKDPRGRSLSLHFVVLHCNPQNG